MGTRLNLWGLGWVLSIVGCVGKTAPLDDAISGGAAGDDSHQASAAGSDSPAQPDSGIVASGGASVSSSATGASSLIPQCIPGASAACACTDGTSGAQICEDDGTFSACQCSLADVRAKLLGAWSGTRTTKWDGQQEVEMEFRDDGTYSGKCLGDCVALYWGSDEDSAEKTYSVDLVNADGTGFGRITIWFWEGNTNSGEMRDILFNAEGNTLSFEAWQGDYGPLSFALKR